MAVAAPTDTELDRDALWAWGVRYGAAARPPRVVTLAGDLGAGKTTLAQAICAGFGVTEVVTSPTFALVHEYASPLGEVLHLDLYRLEDALALESIGLEELLARDALVLVEWPERALGRIPTGADRLSLMPGSREDRRRLTQARP